ncbi:hypothetical protein D3C72_2515680 [compost metagenome]
MQTGLEGGLAIKAGAIEVVVETDTPDGQTILKHQDLAGRSHPESNTILQTH